MNDKGRQSESPALVPRARALTAVIYFLVVQIASCFYRMAMAIQSGWLYCLLADGVTPSVK